MKKVLTLVICIALILALAVPAFAESKARIPTEEGAVIFEDDFSDDELDMEYWVKRENVEIIDGQLKLGGGNWIAEGYAANVIPEDEYFDNYVLDFDFTSSSCGCYLGVGIRAPENCTSEFNNGGRFDIPSANELSTGISFDLVINGKKDYIGVALNYGEANGDAAQFLVAYPDGFDGKSGHVRVIDTGSLVSLFVNEVEVVTLELGFDTVTAYDANGEQIYEGAATFPEDGTVGFYQRNAKLMVDNVKITAFKDNSATEAPTAAPTAAPTDAPATKAPDPTEAPKTTDAPKDAQEKDKPNLTGLWIALGVVAVAAIAAVVIVAAKKKKK